MLEILPIEPDDEIIICDYIEQEWLDTGGDIRLSTKVKNKMYAEINGEDGVKIIDTESKKIIGFAVYKKDSFSGSVMLISFYIAKGYRLGKANYMLMKNVIEYSEDKEIFYIPLNLNSSLPNSVCKNGIINRTRVIEWLALVENR